MKNNSLIDVLCNPLLALTENEIIEYIADMDIEKFLSEFETIILKPDKVTKCRQNLEMAHNSNSTSLTEEILSKIRILRVEIGEKISQHNKKTTSCEMELDSDETNAIENMISDIASQILILKRTISENSTSMSDIQTRMAAEEELLNTINNEHISMQSSLDGCVKKINSAQQQLDNSQQSLIDATKQSKDVLNQSIEVIGIFVAIITIFIGGFSEISLFGTIDNLNTYKFFLYIIVTGHIMANLIFMFIYMLGRITNKTISASCIGYMKIPIESSDSESKCQNCCYKSSETCIQYEMDKEHCTLARKLRYKYPYIYYTNLVAIVAEVLLCLGWLFSQDILVIKSGFWTKTLILVVVVLLMSILVKKTLSKIKKLL